MRRNPTELSYRRAAVQNASHIGLVIILYDMLIEDLHFAIAAIQQGDIEKRASELKHGFMVLQQLEGSLDMENGGDAARNLSRFYSVIRANLLEAHFKSSAPMLQRQIELLQDVRQAWEQANASDTAANSTRQAAESQEAQASSMCAESAGAGWSA
jgi:flagellar secretion chaperone FliS